MTEFEKMGCTYRQEGDYFLPNLKIGEQDEVLIGVWGDVYKRQALPLQQRHPVPGVGEGCQRRHQAGGPAADDADLTHGAVPPAACG